LLPCRYDNKRDRFRVKVRSRVRVRLKVRVKLRIKVRVKVKVKVRIRAMGKLGLRFFTFSNQRPITSLTYTSNDVTPVRAWF
jgi:hypothetical protein